MKIVLAGAFGNLGAEILKCLCKAGHEVVAADLKERPVEGCEGKYTFVSIDATNPETLKGLCEGADIAIRGNSFDGSSEPGIVWVMQDENGNGLADDTWYELRGSEWGKEETILDYAVTYYRPSGTGMAVAWEDNIGNSGTVDYLKSFHTQDYYYPTWITEDSYTLRGTRLEARNYDKSGNGSLWVQPAYDWGYADNNSPTDCADAVNSLDIANAVDCMGESVDLNFVDFVKIQCAVQAKSGWVGELSTEVCGISEITE